MCSSAGITVAITPTETGEQQTHKIGKRPVPARIRSLTIGALESGIRAGVFHEFQYFRAEERVKDASQTHPLFQSESTDSGQEALARSPSERRFWRWTTVGLGLVAFGKGIREPNLWSYTQAQFDYSAGFTRRGLFGAALGRLLSLNRYHRFALVSTALLLLLFALLALLARESKLARRVPPGELLAVYASSYSVSFLAHLNGYLDIPLALLCVAPLFARSTGMRLALAVLATVLGALIHEQFLFCFLPVLAVSVIFQTAVKTSAAQRRLAWLGGCGLLMLGLALAAGLAWRGSISPAQAERLNESISLRADHPLEPEVLKALPRTARENAEIMKRVWRRPTFLPAQLESLLMFGPTAAVLSWGTFLVLREWVPRGYRWLYALALLATLAPLSLNLVGWDKNRWNEMLCLNAFLILLAISSRLGGEPVRLPLRFRRACLWVMLLNMATGGGMFDNRHIRPFPFMRSPDTSSAPMTSQ
jgi:hypothetical protein